MTTATLSNEKTLETRVGSLAGVYPQFKPETLQQADERNVERVTNPEIRALYGWTANVAVYCVEKNPVSGQDSGQDEAFLYFGGRDAFNAVIGKNLAQAISQLSDISKSSYMPTQKEVDIDAVVSSSLRIKISDLELLGDKNEYGYFEIDTSDVKAKKLNAAQRAFAEKVYGSLEEKTDKATGEKYTDFARTMNMLSEAGKATTKIYALKSGYVADNVNDKTPVIARACWLDDFGSGSDFDACSRDVDLNFGSLRGVRVAGGDEPKEAGVAPQETEKKLDELTHDGVKGFVGKNPIPLNRPDIAAVYLKAVNDFYQAQQ